jgi:peptidoglycan/LPS O-acetylase OafA/YrhL
MSDPLKSNSRYIPALDGLRALAVAAVIAYHLDLGWAPGGFAGVGVFFVLSGYLITGLLVSEWRRNGRINLKEFWIRRARRLLPAMAAVLAATVLVLAVTDPSRLTGLWGDLGAAVLYISNWWLIFHQVSYFESFGPPSPLGHFWSLAVEEQFYLIWPLLMAFMLAVTTRRWRLLLFVAGGVLLSALAMALLYEPGSDPSRVYYGTDTRAFALLAGAALALLYPAEKAGSRKLNRAGKIGLELCGAAGLVITAFMVVRSGEYDTSLYPGGLLLLSAASALLIGAVSHPASVIGKVLSCKPLRWIGVRSYGLYLWHYPVIVLAAPSVQGESRPLWQSLLLAAAAVMLSALSWKFIEEPIKKDGLKGFWKRTKERRRSLSTGWSGRRTHVAASLSMVIVLCMSCSGYVGTGATKAAVSLAARTASVLPGVEGTALEAGGGYSAGPAAPAESGEDGVSGHGNSTPSEAPASQPQAADHARNGHKRSAPGSAPVLAPAGSAGQAAESGTGGDISIIGDSVIIDAEPYLRKELPDIVVDGKIGRQLSQAQEVVEQLKRENRLGSRVVIELGTNGSFTEKQLKGLMDSLQDAERIVFINTRVPKKWQDTVNEALSKAVGEYPHAVLADWYGSSEGAEGYFEKDGVHLKPKGAEAYASVVLRSLRKE